MDMDDIIHYLFCLCLEGRVVHHIIRGYLCLDHRSTLYLALLPVATHYLLHLPCSLSLPLLLVAGTLAFNYLTPRLLPTTSRAILITGCDTGLGYHLARVLPCLLGVNVFAGCLDVNSEGGKDLRAMANAVCGNEQTSTSWTPSVTVLQMDITDTEQIMSCVERVTHQLRARSSQLWGVVHNAASWSVGEIEFTPVEELKKQINVNLIGTATVSNAFLPLVKECRGRIIFISSAAAILPTSPAGAYAVSKRGLECLADLLRLEMKKWGVDVVTVRPCAFQTGAQDGERCLAVWHRLQASITADMWRTYGHEYIQHIFHNGTTAPKQTDLQPFVDAVVHALFSVRPGIVYPCGTLARTILSIYPHLPDSWKDTFITCIQHGAASVKPALLLLKDTRPKPDLLNNLLTQNNK